MLDPVTRENAQEAAREELSRDVYAEAEPTWLVRAVRAIARWLNDLIQGASEAAPGGGLGLLALVVVVVAGLALLRARLGPLRQGVRRDALHLPGPVSPDELRAQADTHAAAARWAEAVRARLRAVVRELEVRGVLDPRPGRTATEVAAEAGAALPALRARLWAATGVFAEIWYGGRAATPDDDAVVRALDADLEPAMHQPASPPPDPRAVVVTR